MSLWRTLEGRIGEMCELLHTRTLRLAQIAANAFLALRPHGAKPALDPGNVLHRALLRLESGLAIAKIAKPVPRDRPLMMFAACAFGIATAATASIISTEPDANFMSHPQWLTQTSLQDWPVSTTRIFWTTAR